MQLSRDLDCQYKTAFVLAHKLREAMAKGNDDVALSGTVEIDGAYFGGHVRPENRKEDRKDRRRSENRDTDRRVVVVLRQRKGRTLPFVVLARPMARRSFASVSRSGASCTRTKARIGRA